jgi:sugar/nucleoside kinase (ribokinase family)
MFDVITFGSATQDIFFTVEKKKDPLHNRKVTKEDISFSLGSKVGIQEVRYLSGGGGTNVAATFAQQGFKTAYNGVVGNDIYGDNIINELRKKRIDASLIKKSEKEKTNLSCVLSVPGMDRTILVYRGASKEAHLPWEKINAKFLYLAPLSGATEKKSQEIIRRAKKMGAKIAMNPGNIQLQSQLLKKIVKSIDLLFVNKEEAELLSGQKEIKDIVRKIKEMIPNGIFVITQGIKGSLTITPEGMYRAKTFRSSKVVDRTGAGDSFASGFCSYWLQSKSIEECIQFGTANATACLRSWGAKNGLLKKGDHYRLIKVEKVYKL